MKNHFLLLIAFVFIGKFTLNAQLKKGDYSIDPSINYRFILNSASNQNNNGSVAFGYDRMITDRIMVGGGLFFLDASSSVFYNGTLSVFPYTVFQVPHRARFYFAQKTFAPFAFLEGNFGVQNYTDENIFVQGLNLDFGDNVGYLVFAGLGANYFINEAISIEGRLSFTLFETGDHFEDFRRLSFNTGFKFYFDGGLFGDIENIKDVIFRKGNIMASGRVGFNQNFDDHDTGNVQFSPAFKFFIQDHLALITELNYNHLKFASANQDIFSTMLGAEYYFPLSDNFYISPKVLFFFKTDERNLSDQSARQISFPVALNFSLFQNNKRLFFGTDYSFQSTSLKPDNIQFRNQTINFTTGVDWFLRENFYFTPSVAYTILGNFVQKGVSVPLFGNGTSRLNLSLGVGLRFSGNGKEE